jgi:hypothetical protein
MNLDKNFLIRIQVNSNEDPVSMESYDKQIIAINIHRLDLIDENMLCNEMYKIKLIRYWYTLLHSHSNRQETDKDRSIKKVN